MCRPGYLHRVAIKSANNNQSLNEVKFKKSHDRLVLDPKKEMIYLGRSKKDCDIVLKSELIPRKQAIFYFRDSQWSIECLNDKNGVYVNGKLLKSNQFKNLEDDHIISFGSNSETSDYIYQFTTIDTNSSTAIEASDLNMSQMDLSGKLKSTNGRSRKSSVHLDCNSRTPNQSVPSNRNKLNTFRMNGSVDNTVDEDQYRLDQRKIRLLETRIKELQDKLDRFKQQRLTYRNRFKVINKRLRLIQHKNQRQAQQLRSAKIILNRERVKQKELYKKLAEQRPIDTNSNSDKSKNEVDLQIVKKYNEIFTDDLICGVCLELYLDPVSATCGHSFCKFCLMEWLKRNLNRRFDCPLCRTSCRGYFKNLVIENVIQKYLMTADEEVLSTRSRLIAEREKVIEESKNDPNNESNNRRMNRFNFQNFHDDALILLSDNGLHGIIDSFANDASSNDDIIDLNDNDEFIDSENDYDEEYSSENDEEDLMQYDSVLDD